MTLDAWLVFAAAAALLCLAPGANNLMALTNGLRYGVLASLVAVAGRLAAFTVMIAITALGLGALLAASELAFQVIKWAGVAYLLYLGVKALRARGGQAADSAGPVPALSLAALARREFLVAIGNPKAILIFTAVFPQFLAPGEPAMPQFAVMGATFLVLEIVAALVYVISGKCFAPLLRDRSSWVNRISGGLLLTAAGLLASASRS
ncbi:MAG: LysE family translocator [Kiloniellaceae bacterium]